MSEQVVWCERCRGSVVCWPQTMTVIGRLDLCGDCYWQYVRLLDRVAKYFAECRRLPRPAAGVERSEPRMSRLGTAHQSTPAFSEVVRNEARGASYGVTVEPLPADLLTTDTSQLDPHSSRLATPPPEVSKFPGPDNLDTGCCGGGKMACGVRPKKADADD